MEIKGRHLIEGVPKTITISDAEIRESLAETVNVIVDAVRVALERTPPELSADIVDRGIVLTGGGALLKNLDRRLREETGLPCSMAEDPLSTVVLGAGKMLSNFELLAEDFPGLRHRSNLTSDLTCCFRPPHPDPPRGALPGACAAHFVAGAVGAGSIRAEFRQRFGTWPRCRAVWPAVTDGIGRIWSHYFALVGASRENEELRTRVLDLEGEASGRAGAQRARVGPREALLNLQKSIVAPTLAARVIAGNPEAGCAAGDDRSRHSGRRHRRTWR